MSMNLVSLIVFFILSCRHRVDPSTSGAGSELQSLREPTSFDSGLLQELNGRLTLRLAFGFAPLKDGQFVSKWRDEGLRK
jgi:hypothetical protein